MFLYFLYFCLLEFVVVVKSGVAVQFHQIIVSVFIKMISFLNVHSRKKLSLNLSLQPIQILNGLEIMPLKTHTKKPFKLFEENIGKYFYSLGMRNHKQVVKPRSHKRK